MISRRLVPVFCATGFLLLPAFPAVAVDDGVELERVSPQGTAPVAAPGPNVAFSFRGNADGTVSVIDHQTHVTTVETPELLNTISGGRKPADGLESSAASLPNGKGPIGPTNASTNNIPAGLLPADDFAETDPQAFARAVAGVENQVGDLEALFSQATDPAIKALVQRFKAAAADPREENVSALREAVAAMLGGMSEDDKARLGGLLGGVN